MSTSYGWASWTLAPGSQCLLHPASVVSSPGRRQISAKLTSTDDVTSASQMTWYVPAGTLARSANAASCWVPTGPTPGAHQGGGSKSTRLACRSSPLGAGHSVVGVL